jgi:hypothetical protein
VGHGYGILPITTDVSPMAHARNQAPGFRLFPRMRLKTAKMGDQTGEFWDFEDLPDVRNARFPAYLAARSALPDIALATGILLSANGRFLAEPSVSCRPRKHQGDPRHNQPRYRSLAYSPYARPGEAS